MRPETGAGRGILEIKGDLLSSYVLLSSQSQDLIRPNLVRNGEVC